jgi:hypothetical protein
MTALLIGLITVAAVALTVHSARRTLAERNAVERHHQALETIGALADRAHGSQPSVVAPVAAPREYQPRHKKARPPRRIRVSRTAWVVVAGVVAVLAAVAGGWRLARSHSDSSASGPSPAQASTTSTVAATTVPAPPGPAVLLISSDSRQAEYRLERPSVDLELAPSAPCWVEIRSGPVPGAVVFAGTLRPGNRRRIPTGTATGSVTVLLGNPGAMAVSADGAPLPIPRVSGSQPFTLLLQPAA